MWGVHIRLFDQLCWGRTGTVTGRLVKAGGGWRLSRPRPYVFPLALCPNLQGSHPAGSPRLLISFAGEASAPAGSQTLQP